MEGRWLGSPLCQGIYLLFPLLCFYISSLFYLLPALWYQKGSDHLLFYRCMALSVVAGAPGPGELYCRELWRTLSRGRLTAYRFVESSQEVDFICQRICFGLQFDLVHISAIHILKKRKPKTCDETTNQKGLQDTSRTISLLPGLLFFKLFFILL